mmetsp:Transcript_3477/g.8295  ORF Transcript_3477/g.8295 Transcript_3477/m.8295 type:complete len:216 (+) Transcript_3477:629-1276(+)
MVTATAGCWPPEGPSPKPPKDHKGRGHLDERVHTKSKQRNRLFSSSVSNRHPPLHQVVHHSEERQNTSKFNPLVPGPFRATVSALARQTPVLSGTRELRWGTRRRLERAVALEVEVDGDAPPADAARTRSAPSVAPRGPGLVGGCCTDAGRRAARAHAHAAGQAGRAAEGGEGGHDAGPVDCAPPPGGGGRGDGAERRERCQDVEHNRRGELPRG